ncbi:mechanosensitive ion channel family protein [Caballeronia sp. LZ035]|uniref:mechanosensitive ion channel family protein n=1 Tax=Caballeronia sp. LZ035 TaxID=3038568 RepID=UPI002857BDD8|nr:mechanosensitive ion channel family protein [Caballeronia sp. LZ035]MDR5760837.1 mechanosensitive ion channel family protein [Caballeronia sp. LZ035]
MDHSLILGFALVAIDVAAWSCALPRNEVTRLLIRLVIYSLFSFVLFSSGLSPFSQAPLAGSMTLHVLGQILEIIWWLTGARLLSMALDTLLLPRTWRRQRLFEDVFGAVVFLAAIVAALGFVLELPVRGLVATSGALAIVLGLAIQSTLSDVFAGIVINSTEPYEVGNWVSIDGVDGKVLEMNWRSTNLLTALGDVVIVPNAVAAKAKIVNSSRPAALHGVRIVIEISPEARPKIVLDAVDRALKSVRAILPDPAPFAMVKSVTPVSFLYEATAYVDDSGKKVAVINELYDLCYRHLAAAGVELRSLGATSPNVADADVRVKILRRFELFAPLAADELAQLAPRLSRHEYDAGEVVMTPETVPDSLIIVDTGVLDVMALEGAEQVGVGRLGPGDAIGETGLLAGHAARVTVTALTNTAVYRLQKDDLTPVLKANPEVAKLMCRQLSRRQKALDALGTPTPAAHSEQSIFEWLVDGVRKLHDLKF